MATLNSAVSKLAKVVVDSIPKPRNTDPIRGTAVISDGRTYVKLDGSDQMTPVVSGVEVKDGQRVLVQIIDHRARVTTNDSSPAASMGTVSAVQASANDSVTRINSLIAGTITTKALDAAVARIGTLEAKKASVDALEATVAKINHAEIATLTSESIESALVTTDTLDAKVINSTKINSTYAHITDGKIDNATIDHAKVNDLATAYAQIDLANVDTANVKQEFVDKLLVQGSFVAQNGTVYQLVGLHLDANDITAGTLTVDHIAVMGDDGEYYALSPNGDGTFAQTKLDGSIIRKDSIHADRIMANTITTDQITVNNLEGTGGWINLASGTFQYSNADSGNGISWDGEKLSISADDITIGMSKAVSQSDLAETNQAVSDANDSIADTNAKLDAASDALDTIRGAVDVTQNAGGDPVVRLSTNGANADMVAELTNTELGFLDKGSKVAWVGSAQFHATELEVTGSITEGDWRWRVRSNGNLSLKFVGGASNG